MLKGKVKTPLQKIIMVALVLISSIMVVLLCIQFVSAATRDYAITIEQNDTQAVITSDTEEDKVYGYNKKKSNPNK